MIELRARGSHAPLVWAEVDRAPRSRNVRRRVLARYLDRADLGEGWLVMFALRKELPWADKLFVREVEHAAKNIRVVGC